MKVFERGLKLITGLFAGSVLVLGLYGCDNPIESDDDEVSITLDEIGTIQAGSNGQVGGTIESSPAIDDIEFTITDSAGNAVSSDLIDVEYLSSMVIGSEDVDLTDHAEMVITVDDSAYNGTYTLNISVDAGTANSNKDAEFTVTGGKEGGSQGTTSDDTTFSDVTLMVAASSGDNANNCASIDGSTFTYNEGTSSPLLQASCDFVYYYTDEAIISAPSAVSDNINGGYSDWSNLNETVFKEATSSDWEDAQAGVDGAIASAAEGASANQATGLSVGDVYAFVTDIGSKKGLIKVTDLDPGFNADKYITIDIIVEK